MQYISVNGQSVTTSGNVALATVVVPTVPYEKDDEFIAQFNGEVSKVLTDGSEYICIGGYSSFNNNNAIEANETKNMQSLNTTNRFLNTSFNIRTGFSATVADFVKTPTGFLILSFGDYQQYSGRLYHIKNNGDYDTQSQKYGTGITSTISGNGTGKKIGILSDGSIIVYSPTADINYKGVVYKRIIKIDNNGDIDTTFMTNTGTQQNTVSTLASGIYVDSLDNIWVHGNFTTWNGVSCNRLVKLLPNGSVDTSFVLGTGFNGDVNSVYHDGTNLFVGGNFTTWKGSATGATRITKLDMTGSIVAGWITTGASAAVGHIVCEGSDMYIGGGFTTYGGVAARGVLKIDMTTGNKDTAFINGTGLLSTYSTSVNRIVATNTGVLLLNSNSSRNGTAFTGLIANISKTGALVPMPVTAFTTTGRSGMFYNGYVYLTFSSPYALFNNYNAKQIKGMMKVNNKGSIIVLLGRDNDYTFIGGAVEDGGSYYYYSGGSIKKVNALGVTDTTYIVSPESSFCGIDLDGTEVVASSYTQLKKYNATGGSVRSVSYTGTQPSGMIKTNNGKFLVFGAAITGAAGHLSSNAVLLNGNGTVDTSFSRVAGSPVVWSAYHDQDGSYWLGGTNTIVHVSSIGVTIPFSHGAFTGLINCFCEVNGIMYVGGTFTTIGGVACQYFVGLDKVTGAILYNPGLDFNGNVKTIVYDGSGLIIGGNFTTYKGETANRIVRIFI